MTKEIVSFKEAIKRALMECMGEDNDVICFGLGTTDPTGIFGTTIDLEEIYGEERVFDMPTSENAMTGIGVGAAISGLKVVMSHQRLDFLLLGMDQIVNSAAKMSYMFGGKLNCPITIRVIIGRGWGQGPTHSQNLHAWFAHIPGLKVLMPTLPGDAYHLLKEAIKDPDPVIFLEHRWLYNTKGELNKNEKVKIGGSKIIKGGDIYTVIASGFLMLEAVKAANYLKEKEDISVELIDLITIKPIDYRKIKKSVKKTGRLCVVDSGYETGSIAAEIIATISEDSDIQLKGTPIRLAMKDIPEPTSYGLTKGFNIRAKDIAGSILGSLGRETQMVEIDIPEEVPHDVPGEWFKGPF